MTSMREKMAPINFVSRLLASLLLILGWRTVVLASPPTITLGGSGYALQLDGDIFGSANLSLNGSTGLTITYWLNDGGVMEDEDDLQQLLTVSSPIDGEVLLSVAHGGNTWSISVGSSTWIARRRTSASPWRHFGVSVNSSDGLLMAVIDGKRVDLLVTSSIRPPTARLMLSNAAPSIKPDDDSCTRTTGGYVTEDSFCVFPFSVNGKTTSFDSCASWSDVKPFVNAQDAPRPSANMNVTSLAWCPTTSKYSTTNQAVRQAWGFCSCYDYPSTEILSKVHLAMEDDIVVASYSGPVRAVPLVNVSVVVLNSCVAGPFSVFSAPSADVVLVEIPRGSNCSNSDAWATARIADQAGSHLVLFAFDDGKPLPRFFQPTKTLGLLDIQVRPVVDPDHPFSALHSESIDQCRAEQNLLDGVLATSHAACTIQLVTSRGPPFATNYSFVIPGGINLSSWTWRVSTTSDVDSPRWFLVDARSGTSLPNASGEDGAPRQYFFDLARLTKNVTSTRLDKKYEVFLVEFASTVANNSCSQFKIAEIGFHYQPASIQTDAVVFASGNLGDSSYYFNRFGMGRFDHLNPLVASLRRTSSLVQALRKPVGQRSSLILDMDATAPFSVAQLGKLISDSTLPKLHLGQDPIATSSSMDSHQRLLDDLLIFNVSFSHADFEYLFRYGKLRLRHPNSRFAFDSMSGANTGTQSAWMTFSRLSNSAILPSFIPSSALNHSLEGGDYIIGIGRNESARELILYGTIPFPLNALKVKTAIAAGSGRVTRLGLVQGGSLDFKVMFTYEKTQQATWRSDVVGFQVLDNDAGLSHSVSIKFVTVDPPNAPQNRELLVKPGLQLIVNLHREFSPITNQPWDIVVDVSKVKLGKLSLLSNCSDVTSGRMAPSIFASRYSVPSTFPSVSGNVSDEVMWRYTGSNQWSVIRFTLINFSSSPSAILPSYVLAGTSPVLGTGQRRAPLLELLLNETDSSNVALELVEPPSFGRLFVVNTDDGTSRELTVGYSHSVETSTVLFGEAAWDVSVEDTMTGQCLCGTDSCGCTEGPRLLLEGLKGEPDEIVERIQGPGTRVLHVDFAAAMKSSQLSIRLKRPSPSSPQGAFPLRRIFIRVLKSRFTRDFTFPADPCVTAMKTPLRRFVDDDLEGAFTWIVAWTADCIGDNGISWPVSSDGWQDITLPLCSFELIESVRMEWFSHSGADFVLVDSVALQGTMQSDFRRMNAVIGQRVQLVYESVDGVNGRDRFKFRSASTSCSSNRNTTTVVIPFEQNEPEKTFQQLPTVLAHANGQEVFDLEYMFDFSTASLYVQDNVFLVQDPLDRLWPIGSTMRATLTLLAKSNPQQILFQGFQELRGSFAINRIAFPVLNLNRSFLSEGDLTVLGNLTMNGLSPQLGAVEFLFSGKVLGGCGQASSELGACSVPGRSLLPQASCDLIDGEGYACSCYKAKTLDSDIVFAGEFCQYNSFSTCFGRGFPKEDGRCDCFDKTMFGSEFCQKRATNVTREALLLELNATRSRFAFALASLSDISSIRVEDVGDAAELSATDLNDKRVSLIRLPYLIELNDDNNCHGHGIPVGDGKLNVTECQCQEEFRPNKNCITKIICSPGQYIQDDTCADCPDGFYCDSGVRKMPCPEGTFTVARGSYKCFKDCIEAGYENSYVLRNFTGSGRARCELCNIGHFCDGLISIPCPAGTYGSKSLVCIACNEIDLSLYTDTPGSLSCSRCPPGTVRQDGSPGQSIKECTCAEGRWNGLVSNWSLSGVPCVDCPENAICDGFIPIPRISNNNFTRFRQLQGEPGGLPMGIYQNARPYPAEGYWGDPKYPSEFFPCSESCLGGANYSCLPAYTGRMCSVCAEGYQRVNGNCYPCPSGESNRMALVILGIWGVLLLFVMINRASEEVQALDIALLYTQVANLVQQFSFVWPPPVSALNDIYAITSFDIDFVSFDCVAENTTWTFIDRFYVQWFFIWYVGAFVLLMNGLAYWYSGRQESKTRSALVAAEERNIRLQFKRAASAAARLARGGSHLTDEQTNNAERANVSKRIESTPVTSPSSTAILSPAKSASRHAFRDSLLSHTFSSSSLMSGRSLMSSRARSCRCCNRRPCARGDEHALLGRTTTEEVQQHHLQQQESDPRILAVKRWLRKTIGLPKTRAEYRSYTNGQFAGWLNLVRVVYNSLVMLCLNAFFCTRLADDRWVMRAWPEEECGTSMQVALFALGVIGFIGYGLVFPALVYFAMSYGARQDLKANKTFMERFGKLYVVYQQDHFKWELMVLFRRFALCVVVVWGDGLPYVQAIVAGIVLVLCLSAQVYWTPYLSPRINTLETVVLASVVFYLLCGMVFTGLHDLSSASVLDQQTQDFAEQFSTALSYILLFVSVLTVAVCFIIFFYDLREYFSVLIVERALLLKAKSEDAALIRVIRSENPKLPRGYSRIKRSETTKVSKSTRSLLKNVPRRLSAALGTSTSGARKDFSALFDRVNRDGDDRLSREELMAHLTEVLKVPPGYARAKIDQIFGLFDLDDSNSIELEEFMAIMSSAMPLTGNCELKKTIKPKYLTAWASESMAINPLVVALFFELDDAVKPFVEDSSPVSAYRDNSTAAFYRSLVQAFPFVIDWLASANSDEIRSFHNILTGLRECQDVVGKRGTYGRMIEQIDSAPIAYWLVTRASNDQRAIFGNVMHSIAEASKTHGSKQLPIWSSGTGWDIGRGDWPDRIYSPPRQPVSAGVRKFRSRASLPLEGTLHSGDGGLLMGELEFATIDPTADHEGNGNQMGMVNGTDPTLTVANPPNSIPKATVQPSDHSTVSMV